MLHKNAVQNRIRKAEESLGRRVDENRHDVELALQAAHWLGSSALQPGMTVMPGRVCADRHPQASPCPDHLPG